MDATAQIARSHGIGTKVALMLYKRTQAANQAWRERVREADPGDGAAMLANMAAATDPGLVYSYAIDAAQRAILYWETLLRRGDNYVENAVQGLKPVLHFDYETVMDGRGFERPVNYALLRIKPPEGVTIDPDYRPYLIIDPRAGHGPGIGGFKDDSQVGVALRAGHPVYFVVFYRDPEPGQTLLDVCEAEQRFVKKVRELHPKARKPAIIGNCQGGWAAMMVAAFDPEETGPIVINGAPMSYWGGAWTSGDSDNPMRYAGGMLGGTWLASMMADLGNGKFDGAHLVQNFENLNPANSLWDKYYHLFDKADTEPPRFLEFEHWWGGYYLMNREEIEWITRNLFVGNTLWGGGVKSASGEAFDLREIQSPIILFASMGDNITPPQQAFNWVLDVYGSTEEIKARGQVIVGLLHQDVGHLGIFVSGKVAKKEHAQIVSVLNTIEALAPGLYGMQITEASDPQAASRYEVTFEEYRLEDVAARLNRFERTDENAFEAVAEVSEFIQRGYELFAQPYVQAMSNEYTAQRMRALHPLRVQNWGFSALNPWLWWLRPAAEAVRGARHALPDDHPLRQRERRGAELVSASLDYGRALRDAATEASFFMTYANIFSRYLADERDRRARPTPGGEAGNARALPVVREALDAIAQGGYVEALARVGYLLGREGEPTPLSRLELRQALAADYAEYLPRISAHAWRRIRGRQETIVRHERDKAIETLALLLHDSADRERLVALLEKLSADPRVRQTMPDDAQAAMLSRILEQLAAHGSQAGKPSPPAARAA